MTLAVGEVLNTHKMERHFEQVITETAFSFARKTEAIAAEAATRGIYTELISLDRATLGAR